MHAESIAIDAEVEALLAEADLPTSDLSTAHNLELYGVREAGSLIGLVGIELYGEVGLLRSLVVAGAHRGAGLGRGLVANVEARALRNGISALYLLTMDAAAFFASLGYAVIARSEVPDAIRGTRQFAGLCPASSSFMCKRLASDGSPAAGV